MHDAIRVAMKFLLIFDETNFMEYLKSTKSVKFTALEIRVPYGMFTCVLRYTYQIVSRQAAVAIEGFKTTSYNPGFKVYQNNWTSIVSDLQLYQNQQPGNTKRLILGSDI